MDAGIATEDPLHFPMGAVVGALGLGGVTLETIEDAVALAEGGDDSGVGRLAGFAGIEHLLECFILEALDAEQLPACFQHFGNEEDLMRGRGLELVQVGALEIQVILTVFTGQKTVRAHGGVGRIFKKGSRGAHLSLSFITGGDPRCFPAEQ